MIDTAIPITNRLRHNELEIQNPNASLSLVDSNAGP